MAEVLCVSVALASALRDRGEERKEGKDKSRSAWLLANDVRRRIYVCIYIWLID